MKNNQKPSHSKGKGHAAKLQKINCNALNSNTKQVKNLKYKGYKEVFQSLGTYGVTFEESNQRYFVLYHKLEKFLTIDLNHQKQTISICCFDSFMVQLLKKMIVEKVEETDIVATLINVNLLQKRVVKNPVIKSNIKTGFLKDLIF
ncbi:hypothetical protein HW132_28650 [Brasilonema sp. CT11]|nr:hypothetical protein [Brasilonema sp. CT11]